MHVVAHHREAESAAADRRDLAVGLEEDVVRPRVVPEPALHVGDHTAADAERVVQSAVGMKAHDRKEIELPVVGVVDGGTGDDDLVVRLHGHGAGAHLKQAYGHTAAVAEAGIGCAAGKEAPYPGLAVSAGEQDLVVGLDRELREPGVARDGDDAPVAERRVERSVDVVARQHQNAVCRVHGRLGNPGHDDRAVGLQGHGLRACAGVRDRGGRAAAAAERRVEIAGGREGERRDARLCEDRPQGDRGAVTQHGRRDEQQDTCCRRCGVHGLAVGDAGGAPARWCGGA